MYTVAIHGYDLFIEEVTKCVSEGIERIMLCMQTAHASKAIAITQQLAILPLKKNHQNCSKEGKSTYYSSEHIGIN